MSISKYISELLQKQDYLIIPDFGAFVANYKPAQWIEKEEVIVAPGRTISFNQELKMNDGTLVNFVALNTKTAGIKARQMVDQFVNDLNYHLDHGETVTIENLGTLQKQGSLYIFTAFPEACLLPDSFGLEPVSLRKPQPEAVVPAPTQSIQNSTYNNKKTNRAWWLALPAAAVVIVALLFFLNDKSTIKTDPKLTETVEQTAVEPQKTEADSLKHATAILAADSAALLLKQPVFYLVGGSFRTLENAGEYFDRMKNKGFEPLHLGQIGNFFLVAIGSFNSEKEASNAQYKILNRDSTAGVWIYNPLKKPHNQKKTLVQ